MYTEKISVFFIAVLLGLLPVSAQQGIFKGVAFTTGGVFLGPDNQVMVGMIDPGLIQIDTLGTSPGDFSNAIIQDGQYVYAHIGRATGHPAGSDLVIKYNVLTGEAVDSILAVAGLQSLLAYKQYLVASRGFGTTENYIQVYLKDDLSAGPVYEDTTLAVSANGIVALEDTAYIGYNQEGVAHLAKIYLGETSPLSVESVALDSTAANLSDLYTDGTVIYGLSEVVEFPAPDFLPVIRQAGLTVFDPLSQSSETFPTPRANTGIGIEGMGIFGNFGGGLERFNLNTLAVQSLATTSFTAGSHNPIDGSFFLQQTDFFSYGRILHMDMLNGVVDTFSTDISGTALQSLINYPPIAQKDSFEIGGDTSIRVGELYFLDVLANDLDTDGNQLRPLLIEDFSGSILIRNDSVFLDPGIADAVVTFQYAAIDEWGDGDTTSVNVIISPGVNREEELFAGSVAVYPNPTQDNVFVKSSTTGELELSLMDLQGHVLQKHSFRQESQVNLAGLAPGYYVLRLEHNGNYTYKKILLH